MAILITCVITKVLRKLISSSAMRKNILYQIILGNDKLNSTSFLYCALQNATSHDESIKKNYLWSTLWNVYSVKHTRGK